VPSYLVAIKGDYHPLMVSLSNHRAGPFDKLRVSGIIMLLLLLYLCKEVPVR
jgi:hypothetical protein